MNYIQSKDNNLVKQIKKLKDKKYRSQENSFLIEGFRFVEEALISQFHVSHIFINEEIAENQNTIDFLNLVHKDTDVYIVDSHIIKDLSFTENPQGIIAVVKGKDIDLNNREGFYVVADKIQDPGNMGTIIRTAHAAGALGVIYTKGTVDIFNDKTLRSTMGSIFNVPIIADNDLNIIKELKSKGFDLIVSSLDTDNNFYDINLCGNVMICVGNEGNGVSKELIELADEKIKIPMPGGAESLNVAVATSIMLYEIVRQKSK